MVKKRESAGEREQREGRREMIGEEEIPERGRDGIVRGKDREERKKKEKKKKTL